MPRTTLFSAACFALLAACGKWSSQVEIPFEVRFDGRSIACSGAPSGALTDLRFYVHDVVLIDADGRERAVRLEPDGVWQNAAVALLDLEDGTGTCQNGTPQVNRSIRGTVRSGADVRGLRFAIGVPDRLNHGDPMRAEVPLSYSVMHWHWRSGYKFMRAGVRTAGDLAWLHLGSAKCAGSIGAIDGCAAPNRPIVELAPFDPAKDRVIIDVGVLLGPSRLDDGTPWDCQSGPGETQCAQVFSALGLEFDSGRTVGSAPAFSAERRR